jgi:hypothetical protein
MVLLKKVDDAIVRRPHGRSPVTPALLALHKRFSGDEDRTDGQGGRRHGSVITSESRRCADRGTQPDAPMTHAALHNTKGARQKLTRTNSFRHAPFQLPRV